MKIFYLLLLASCLPLAAEIPQSIVPTGRVELFQVKDLSGFTTWLEGIGTEDKGSVFSVKDGVIHISGVGRGYVGPKQGYKDYRLSVEYKWGKKTDGGKYVRNSGLLIHATGRDGHYGDKWMASVECQFCPLVTSYSADDRLRCVSGTRRDTITEHSS